ncbi:hypothetical protein BMG05_25700 [Mycobacterium malmoense]|nr:hypothetical protein BMG05_25700 [Mycobacterium malmoense]
MIALTPTVSNDVAASTVTIQHRAVELTDDVVNPIQTWLEFFQDSVANLQTIFQTASEIPFPVAQQLAANWIDYASIYVGAYQGTAGGIASYFTQFPRFWSLLLNGISNFQQANFVEGIADLVSLLWSSPIATLQDMESALEIPTDITQNLANFTALMDGASGGSGITAIGAQFIFEVPNQVEIVAGHGIQNIYDSFSSGNVLGGLTNLLNYPGFFTQGVVNGFGSAHPYGLLWSNPTSNPPGFLQLFTETLPQQIAAKIVAPGAVNIMDGGSLLTAFQNLMVQITTGWPAPQVTIDNLVNAIQMFFSQLPAALNLGGATAAGALPVGIAGAVPSIAADLSGIAPSIATNIAGTLAPELGRLAVNVLTSLF